MSSNPDTVIIIPVRMASTRLPGKPLADICGKPMFIHVVEQAIKSKVADIYIACCEEEVAITAKFYMQKAVLTNPKHISGTDRIYEALDFVDKAKRYKYIINLQGDLPNIEPKLIAKVLEVLKRNPKADIATLCALIEDKPDEDNPNIVKPVITFHNRKGEVGRALYFTRSRVPYGEGPIYQHIGIYAYTREALEKFVTLTPTYLETREKLEQLRAVENDMIVDIAIVTDTPIGVDTMEDLIKVREMLGHEE